MSFFKGNKLTLLKKTVDGVDQNIPMSKSGPKLSQGMNKAIKYKEINRNDDNNPGRRPVIWRKEWKDGRKDRRKKEREKASKLSSR